MSPTFLLAASLFVLRTTITQTSPPKVETLRGAHFELTAHFDAPQLAQEALAAAEAIVPHLEPLFGKVMIERKGAVVIGTRIPIHLYWKKFDWEGAGPKPGPCAREFAFTSNETNAGYVVITPPSVMNALATTGLPLHVKLDVARVAGLLWARRASPSAPRWPYWFLEGGAAYAAEEGCKSRGWLKVLPEYPLLATELLRVQALERAGGLPSVFDFVDSIPGGLTTREREAVAIALFRFLKEPAHKSLLDQAAYAARATKQDDAAAAVARVVRSVAGDTSAQEALDKGFVAWLHAQKPAWQELHGVLWPLGDTWIQAADLANAMAWRADVTPVVHYEVTGKVALFPAERRQANLLVGRGEHTFVQIAFVADHGVDVARFDTRLSEAERWQQLGSAEVKSVKEGAFLPFRVVVDKSALQVWLEEKPILSITDVGAPLSGAFGLGAFAGSCCAWQEIAFKALP